MFGMWNVQDVGCLGCGIFSIWDVRYVECSGCGMFGMWDVQDVGSSGCEMWDVIYLPDYINFSSFCLLFIILLITL